MREEWAGCIASCGQALLELTWDRHAPMSLDSRRTVLRMLGVTGFSSRIALAAILATLGLQAGQLACAPVAFRIEITAVSSLLASPVAGRLFVVLGRKANPEPRTTIGQTGMDAASVFGMDIGGFDGTQPAILDDRAAAFPVARLTDVPAGEYVAQAVLDTNIDVKSLSAPGNLYSTPTPVRINPSRGGIVQLRLTERVPDEQLPSPTELLRWIKIRSTILSEFHKRPIHVRAGVILPRDYETNRTRRYPLRIHIGGYGASYRSVERMMKDDAPFRKTWLSDETPRMLLLHLDGDGPLGDPYQVNSANHGPYGDALVKELIPYVEREFRVVTESRGRTLDGESTGGWVSLALQIFYPDLFNGTWSSCPDAVDFRGFQLVNIYEDKNVYVNVHGFERPSARDAHGDVRFTMRHEVQMENVLGRGDSWTMSGGQWGAWNATYGPRGAGGRPVPLWDPKTGLIDRSVVEHWKQYDLRRILEANWSTLAPKLRGKIHIVVSDADDYFLNNAARMLEAFFQKALPPYQGRMVFNPLKGHCDTGVTDLMIMKEMAARTGARP